MKYKKVKKKALKIYCDNTDKIENEQLWEYILNSAKDFGLKGATVYKAVAGIGSTQTIHRFDLLTLSSTMPIVIEIIEDEDILNNFLDSLSLDIKDIYAIMYDVEVLE